MIRKSVLSALTATVLLPVCGAAQIPPVGTLLFEDSFGGTSLNADLWQSTPSTLTVSGGAVTIPLLGEFTARQLFSGSTVVVDFEDIVYPGEDYGVRFKCLIAYENGTAGTPVMQTVFDAFDLLSTPAAWSFGTTVDGSPVSLGHGGPNVPASRVTLVITRTRAEIYQNGTLLASEIITGFPAGPYTILTRIEKHTGSGSNVSIGRVRVWTTDASTERSTLAAPAGITTTVSFPSFGWTGSIANNSPYSSLIRISETASTTPGIPQPHVVGGKYFTLKGIGGLVSPATATMSYTFPMSELTATGSSMGTLRAWKREGSGNWYEIPANFVDIGGSIRADLGPVTSFSDFAIGAGDPSGAANWFQYP